MFNHYVHQQVADAYRASREREAALDQQLKQIDQPVEHMSMQASIIGWFAELRWFRPALSEAPEQRIAGDWLEEPCR